MNICHVLKTDYILALAHCHRFFMLVSALLLSGISLSQQARPETVYPTTKLDSLQKKTDRYFLERPIEKIHVHFDKPFYILGEVSWYKVYVLTDPLSPTNVSSVVNVDWIDPFGNIVKHQRLKIENGGAAGDFTIDTTLSEGTYTVRAYTNWMRNEGEQSFFSRRIAVFDPDSKSSNFPGSIDSSKIDFQFFPEGGTLVTGLTTQIAFKAIDNYGRGIDVQGKIIDKDGAVITTFKSIRNGMGTFPLVPQINEVYHAILNSGKTYVLPAASDTGLTLLAYNMNTEKIFVRIQSSKEHRSSTVYLIGQSQSSVAYAGYIKLDNSVQDVTIAKDQLPEGVLRLTLFDSEGRPQCERNLFIKKDSAMKIDIRSDREIYSARDSIEISFAVRDPRGIPVTTSLSVSVTDAGIVTERSNKENIYTTLLLESDVRGNVEDPVWYFESSANEKVHALDLVMLTHGWSKYSWDKILGKQADHIAFEPENGIQFEGTVVANNAPVANAPFILSIDQGENDLTSLHETDSVGHFSIPDLDFFDSSLVLIRIMSPTGRVQNPGVQIPIAQNPPPVGFVSAPPEIDHHTKELRQKLRGLKAWKPDKFKTLETVVITGQQKKVRNENNVMVIRPDARDINSKLASSQFISRYAMSLSFATLQTMRDGTDVWGVTIMGRFSPISISIDGMLTETTGSSGNPIVLLNSIPIEEIDRVYIGRGGHIAVWTKPTASQQSPESMRFMLKGYDISRQFYHPKYPSSDKLSAAVDNRATLYWNADVQTDKDGMARIKFFNTDYTRALHVVAEGVANGFVLWNDRVIGTQ